MFESNQILRMDEGKTSESKRTAQGHPVLKLIETLTTKVTHFMKFYGTKHKNSSQITIGEIC